MTPQTFIFLGPSGSGKGTQRRMAADYLKEKGPGTSIKHLEMGALLREFWEIDRYTNRKSKKIMDKGGLQPSFIQIYVWAQFFIDNIKEGEHLLVDGSPRRENDAELMDTAFKFYKRRKPNFVFLNVSRQTAFDRLIARAADSGRDEDKAKSTIERRLDWFEEFVLPAINFFRNNPDYNFIEVDGEQPPEKVFQDIMSLAND